MASRGTRRESVPRSTQRYTDSVGVMKAPWEGHKGRPALAGLPCFIRVPLCDPGGRKGVRREASGERGRWESGGAGRAIQTSMQRGLFWSSSCACVGPDAHAAMAAGKKAAVVANLIDESHFIVNLRRCACGRHFLTLFCERVDWADSDDPQTRVSVPVTPREAEELRALKSVDEPALLGLVPGERRFLYHDMPKGAPQTIEWRRGAVFIPAHD